MKRTKRMGKMPYLRPDIAVCSVVEQSDMLAASGEEEKKKYDGDPGDGTEIGNGGDKKGEDVTVWSKDNNWGSIWDD